MNKPFQSEYEFSHEKKEYLTRADLTKMLNEIKNHLAKNKKVKVVIVKE